jgi:MFS family permease
LVNEAPSIDELALRGLDGDGTNAEVDLQRSAIGQVLEPSPHAAPLRGKRRFSASTFDTLGDRAFRWYFFSMSGWFASMNMQMVVRGWLVYDLTNSYAALGLVSLANAIPGLVLSLPGGVIADKVTKKLAVQLGQIANMGISFVLAVLMLAGLIELWHLLACAVLQGGINAMIMPARQSMIPEFVEDERLMNAVALNTAATNVMRLAAPALGGALLAAAGPGSVYMLISGLYLWGAVALIPVPGVKPAPKVGQTLVGAIRGGIADIGLGFRYMNREKVVFLVLTLNLAIVLFSQPYQMLLPGFAKEILDADAGRLGILMSVTGVGALLGSLVIASLPPRNRGMIMMMSALLMGVALLAFSFSTWFWVTIPIMVLIGVGQAGRMSLGSVLLQSYTESSYRGRVMSIYMLEFSITAFMVFVVGAIANFLGIQVALGACSAILLVIVLSVLVFSPRTRSLQ